jgi:alcohol dehydrogenase
MKALVYHGPGQRGWDTVPDPTVADPTDIVVRIDSSTICGTDLHILKGDVPETTPGTVLGHEAVGTVEELGASVGTVDVGDRVLLSCVSSCGRCRFCKEGRYGQCLGGGGWILGHTIHGLQAEYARVPFADTSVYKVPDELTDEQVLFLADILPTSYEVGVLNGMVSPGDTVAIVGAGPIGLAAILTARLYTPGRIVAIDLDDGRLESALRFGADTTINNGREDAHARVMELTGGLGADVAFEAVGVPQTFELAADLIRPCGRVANIGVHGGPVTLHLEKLWSRDVTVTTGLVDTYTIPRLMKLVASGRLDPTIFATHRFALDDTMAAYDTFTDAATTHALKVVLEGSETARAANGHLDRASWQGSHEPAHRPCMPRVPAPESGSSRPCAVPCVPAGHRRVSPTWRGGVPGRGTESRLSGIERPVAGRTFEPVDG